MMGIKIVTLKLKEDTDADIIAWLEGQENVSAAIRDAIRASSGISLLDIYREIQELKKRSFVAASVEPDPVEETSQAANNLDKLLGLK